APSLIVNGQKTGIVIDGDLSDWSGINHVLLEDEVHNITYFDIQKGFLAANNSHLFVRIDFDLVHEEWMQIFGNLTIRTPNESIYILLYWVDYEGEYHSSSTMVIPGRSLDSPYNAENAGPIGDHSGWCEVDLSTKKSVEFAVLLADLGVEKDDPLDVTFWHFEDISAGTVYTVIPTDVGSESRYGIEIDGDFSDWSGINPVLVEDEIHSEYPADVQKAFLAANDTHLFIRVDYAAPLEGWACVLSNFTIRTPNESVYMVMSQVIFDETPHWSFTMVIPGRSLDSPYNAEHATVINDYPGWCEVDLSTNATVELAVLLADLGVQKNDPLDVNFWHYYIYSAGTIYDIVPTDADKRNNTETSTENTTEIPTEIITQPEFILRDIPSFDWFITISSIVIVLLVFKRRQR
ncbi:MAG: hypothetical protein ACFFC7_34910, partial [Candidatus Hermodarchaeota archaeon]